MKGEGPKVPLGSREPKTEYPIQTKRKLLIAAKARRENKKLEKIEKGPITLTDAQTFPEQHAFIHDPHRFKAILATTRAAKSYTAGLDLMESAANDPDFNGLYIALTLGSAREIMWQDVLKTINLKHKLKAQFNASRLTVTLPGGGRFRLVGLDQNADEVLKIQGVKYNKIYIDEAASFRNDLRRMADTVLYHRLSDKLGSLIMISTPSDITQGLFYDVTSGKEAGWKVWEWKAWNNPYVRDNWIADRDRKIAENPQIIHTPHFKQMYLGEWCIDTDHMVYKYNSERNTIGVLPPGEYYYVLGVDFGWHDPTAFVVNAWNLHDKTMYTIDVRVQQYINFDQVAEKIKHLKNIYNISAVIGDTGGGAKQGVETINTRYGLGIITATKVDKYLYQQLMNDDFITGRIKLINGTATAPLAKEYSELVWDERELMKVPPKHLEHPRLANHACDAALYAWRHCHNYASEQVPVYAPGSPEYKAAERAKMYKAATRRQEERDAKGSWENDLDFEGEFREQQKAQLMDTFDTFDFPGD